MKPNNETCDGCMDMSCYRPRKHLSISSLCVAGRCPRKFYYQYGLGLRRVSATNAMTYGTAIHRAVEHAYDGDIDAAMKAFQESFGDTECDEKRNPRRAEALLRDYMRTHRAGGSFYQLIEPPRVVQAAEELSRYELVFAIDVGIDIPFVGRIDGVGKSTDTDELWAVEFKTSSRLGSQFLRGFQTNPQVIGYALALEQTTGKPVAGTIIEGLLAAKASTNTLLAPIHVAQHSKQQFVQWIIQISATISAWEQTEQFPQNFATCTPYPAFGSHGFPCDYEDLCLSVEPENLYGMFDVSPDKPFLAEGEEVKDG